MKKVILSIVIAVAVFFAIALIQSLVRDITFMQALSRPYNYFLAGIAFVGTYTAFRRRENNGSR